MVDCASRNTLYFVIIIIFFTDDNPTSDNVQQSCSAVLDRDTLSYDLNLTVTLDNKFTPAVISGINSIRLTRIEIDARSNPIPGPIATDNRILGSNVVKGPITLAFSFNDVPQLLNGHGYVLSVSIVLLSAVCKLCTKLKSLC